MNSWCNSVKQILRECGLQQNYETKSLCVLSSVETKLSDLHEYNWRNELHKKPKLNLYQKVKKSYVPEKYVTQNLPPDLRSCIAQLRFGVLPLHIKTGRFSGKSRDQRVCNLCNSNKIEDELHFVFSCEKYNDLRHTMYQKVMKQHSDFESKDVYEKLLILLDYPIIFGNFIQKAFVKRQDFLYE